MAKWPRYNQVNWNYMVRNRCQHIILEIFEENCHIFIFYLLINFKFLKDAISGIIFYIHIYKCYQLVLIKEFVSKLRYLCFDLMFLTKINQVILAAIFFSGFKVKVTNGLFCDILLYQIPILRKAIL